MSECCRRLGVPRRWSLSLVAGFCALFSFHAAAAAINPATNFVVNTNPPAPRRPTIVFIVAEDLGFGDLGCYGQKLIRTPNLDKLAAAGMRFTSYYAGSPETAPSRAALLTGRDTGHASVRSDQGYAMLQTGELTVAQILQSAGFRTGALGVWGLGDVDISVPRAKGFDEWFGELNESQAQNHYPRFLNRTDQTHNTLVPVNAGTYADDYFTDVAVKFINNNVPASYTKFRPFFLYLPYTIPRANVELGRATGNGMEIPGDAPYSGELWPLPDKNRAAMITRLDDYVGLLLDTLKARKIDNNSIVIFTSVNGPAKEGGADPKFFDSTGPFRGLKGDLHEGGIRVPLIIRWPIHVPTNTVCDLPCAAWDFLPTLAELAPAPAPAGINGISLLPTLVSGRAQTNRHEFLYWETHTRGFQQAVRMGDWKALRSGADGPVEIYDLKTDPGETNNIAARNPEVVAKITEYLKTARNSDPGWPALTVAENAAKTNSPPPRTR